MGKTATPPDTDNAELEIKRGEQYDVRVTVNAEETGLLSHHAWVAFQGCLGLVRVPHSALRRPAPRVVSEERVAQIICGKYCAFPEYCSGSEHNLCSDKSRAVLSLFAGEAPGPAPQDRFHNPKPGDRFCVEGHLEPAPAEAQEPKMNDPQRAVDTWANSAEGQEQMRRCVEDCKEIEARVAADTYVSPERMQESVGPRPAEAQEPTQAQMIEHLDEQIQTLLRENEHLRAAQPTVTPDTAGARDFAKFLDGDEFTAPLRTALTEVRVWAEAAAAKSANHITTLASQVEKLTGERDHAIQSREKWFAQVLEKQALRIVAEHAEKQLRAELAKAREALLIVRGYIKDCDHEPALDTIDAVLGCPNGTRTHD